MLVRKRVKGEVQYNDGQLAEAHSIGMDGSDAGLLLDTIQLHREDTKDSPEEFRRRLPVGMWLDIVTTIEVSPERPE